MVIPPHVHPCRLCGARVECSDDCAMSREHGVGEPRICTGCSTGIGEIDDLEIDATKRQQAVTVAGGLLTVRDATRAALGAPDPSDRLRVLWERVSILSPLDPTGIDLDTWARTGYVMGALDGLTGKIRQDHEMPPDIPPGLALIIFSGCWQLARMTVLNELMENR